MTTLKLEFPPSSNQYWRRGPHGMYVSQEARAYRDKVAVACRQHHVQPLVGPVCLSIYAAMPSARRDLNNTEKILSDALQGYLFWDDVQIVQTHLYRCEAPAPKRANAHVIVVVEAADEVAQRVIFNRMFPNGKGG